MNKKIKRKCPVCGVRYQADTARLKHGRQTTCSRKCSYDLRARIIQTGKEYKCGSCGKRIYRSPAQIKSRHGLVFCSAKCAYKIRKRIVTTPYKLVSTYDRSTASKQAWKTRKLNPKPYPESASKKAATRMVERIKKGGGVSQFENKAAQIFRGLGFTITQSLVIRRENGTYASVFDIFIPTRRMVIECHGTFWHGGRWSWEVSAPVQSKNLLYEERKHIAARSLGIDLRLLWEHHFNQDPVGACLAVVR